MNEADEERFSTLIRALAETFGAPLSAGQILGYRLGLGNLPLDDIERAVAVALENSKYMPKPAELREMAGAMSVATRATLAWQAVRKAVHSVSVYGSVQFDDDTTTATVRNMGGWATLCNSPGESFETWTRKQFEQVYARLYGLDLHPDQTRALLGLHGEEPKKRFPTGLPPVDRKRLEGVK